MYIIFVGAPGAGKGTQAAVVAREMKLVPVASGDLFRQALEQQTELGKQAKAYMEKGQLVPDEITVEMVLDRLAEPDCAGGALLDGFPRNLGQARALDTALAGQGKGIDKVIYIKVSDEALLKRLGGRWICRDCQMPYHEVDSPPKVKGVCDRCGGELYQRADDNEETVKNRLGVYFTETMPVIDYYAGAGKLVEVDGEGNVKEISKKILAALRRG
ncbi:adenylate kinase [Chloroflexota bacterium]